MSIDDATPAMWDNLRKKYAAVVMEDELTAAEKREGVGTFPEDNVNNPPHYNYGTVECIEAIEESMTPESFRGYLKGNCLKYLWRYERKGKALEDLRKARWYLDKLIDEVEE